MKQVQKMESGDVPEKSSTARIRELNELGIFVEPANSFKRVPFTRGIKLGSYLSQF
jgi:hypothetical protein